MLLTIKEAAAHLGVSADTVRRRIKAGALPSIKQDGIWRVEVGAADAPPVPPADAPGLTDVVEALTAQLAMKDQQIERLHTLLMQSALALAPAPAEHKPTWFMFWK